MTTPIPKLDKHVPTDQAAPELLARRLLEDRIAAVEEDMAADAQDAEYTGEQLDSCDYDVVMPYETAQTILAALPRADLAAPSAPAEVEGLVERLMLNTPVITQDHMDAATEIMPATALTALQAENERLREELSAEKEMLEQSFQSAEELSVLLAKANKRAEKAEADRDALTGAAKDVLAERQRQITAEGWTPEHDDTYQAGDLANAAACYAMTDPVIDPYRPAPVVWPWSASWWKPTDRRRDLVKAGALILAEIELIDRAKLKGDV